MPESDQERILREARELATAKERREASKGAVEKGSRKAKPKTPAPKGPGVSAERASRLLGGRRRQIDAAIDEAVSGLRSRQTTDEAN